MGNAAAVEVRDNAKERKRTQRAREHDPEAWEKESTLRETERKRKDALATNKQLQAELRETERKRNDAERKCLERARNSVAAQRLKAIELDPKSVRAYENLGYVHKDKGDLIGAKQCRRKKPSEEEIESHIIVGCVLRAEGDLGGAEQCFRKSIYLGPKHPGAYWNLGLVFKAQSNFQGAEHCFRRAHGLDPSDPDHLIELGKLLMVKGDSRGAENLLL